MPRFRLSFTERRRRALHVKVDHLDRLEGRNAVTPIGATALGLGLIGGMHASGAGHPLIDSGNSAGTGMRAKPRNLGLEQSHGSPGDFLAIATGPQQGGGGGGAGGQETMNQAPSAKSAVTGDLPESLTFSGNSFASSGSGISSPWHPARSLGGGGGAASAPRGGSGSGAQSTTVAAIQGHSPRPKASAPPALPPTIPGALTASPPTGPATSLPAPVITRNPAAQTLNGTPGPMTSGGGGPTVSSAIAENPSSIPDPQTIGGVDNPLVEFPYFPLYTLDYIQGTVLFPNGYEIGTPNGNVNLRA